MCAETKQEVLQVLPWEKYILFEGIDSYRVYRQVSQCRACVLMFPYSVHQLTSTERWALVPVAKREEENENTRARGVFSQPGRINFLR